MFQTRSNCWRLHRLALYAVIALLVGGATAVCSAASFVVHKPDATFQPPSIVLYYDAETGEGHDWSNMRPRYVYDDSPSTRLYDAVVFLREGIERMTGRQLEVTSTDDLSTGIVLVTLENAPKDVQNDSAVQAALANDGSDGYNSNEAFYIRSEPSRLLVVANKVDGLVCAIPALLESVGYEVLGMGPNWTHVPEHHDGLVFKLETADRPSYYIRGLSPTSGQGYGVGTLHGEDKVHHPADEPVSASYNRWRVGLRMRTASMPGFPGHALQSFHKAVVEHMRSTGSTAGFLVPQTHMGLHADRPEAAEANANHLWINTDTEGDSAGKVFISDGKQWRPQNLAAIHANLDLSVPGVREVIFENMKARAELHYKNHPDGLFILGTDPEDGGGYASLATLLHNPQWYPDYLAAEGIEFGKPYALHGFQGLDQPREIWDPAAPSDTVYGFNNWLLREFDKWVASLPEDQQVTATGKSKAEQVRCSFYSYNYHDVPPNFNLDPRIRVMIASYPKHRGRGKWKMIESQLDTARAMKVLLPREPSGDYWIISLSYYWDASLSSVLPPWSAAPGQIEHRLQQNHDAGFRAINAEIDFNFGKTGLGYYLLAKGLWDVDASAEQLDALRDRWLQRAFGSAWQTMKQYYDFMLPANYPVNGPNTWARAIRLIDEASQQIDRTKEPAAAERIDDLKQFWYWYYLLDSGATERKADEVRTFLWKGQMSYMTAMHMVARRVFESADVVSIVGPELSQSAAHYTPQETSAWWRDVLEHWPLTPVTHFVDGTLADGRKVAEVDLNDLVPVSEFGSTAKDTGFLYNAGYMDHPTFRTFAAASGEPIGFQMYWPADPEDRDRYYIARDMSYSIDWWDAASQTWQPVADKISSSQPSVRVPRPDGKGDYHLVRVSVPAPRPGTYRIEISTGGNLARLTDLGYDVEAGKRTRTLPLTFDSIAQGLTQAPVYAYIPKGVTTFDIEVWDNYGRKFVEIYDGIPGDGGVVSRKIDISERKTHRVPLHDGGSIVKISGNGFAYPFPYSFPLYWAMSPAQLLVPRPVAEADGLTIGSAAQKQK